MSENSAEPTIDRPPPGLVRIEMRVLETEEGADSQFAWVMMSAFDALTGKRICSQEGYCRVGARDRGSAMVFHPIPFWVQDLFEGADSPTEEHKKE